LQSSQETGKSQASDFPPKRFRENQEKLDSRLRGNDKPPHAIVIPAEAGIQSIGMDMVMPIRERIVCASPLSPIQSPSSKKA
jgi:hypothetical protein